MAAPALAGDSTYGTITEVKSVDVVVLDCGRDKYNVRLIGIEAPEDPALAKKGVQLLSNLILKKRVQMRFEYRNDKMEMVARILTLQTAKADVTDAGERLVAAGLARREQGFDYKCGCLTKAETEAKQAKRGIWATH
jgi:endonuclease YncB( thermonuclease family)